MPTFHCELHFNSSTFYNT